MEGPGLAAWGCTYHQLRPGGERLDVGAVVVLVHLAQDGGHAGHVVTLGERGWSGTAEVPRPAPRDALGPRGSLMAGTAGCTGAEGSPMASTMGCAGAEGVPHSRHRGVHWG